MDSKRIQRKCNSIARMSFATMRYILRKLFDNLRSNLRGPVARISRVLSISFEQKEEAKKKNEKKKESNRQELNGTGSAFVS